MEKMGITTYEEAINYLKTSPMFNLSLSSNELFHSNFLYWISKVNFDAFKKIINSLIGEENYWQNHWRDKTLEVRREYKNFDLSIVEVLNTAKSAVKEDATDNAVDNATAESDNGDYTTDGLILFVLENKVKSIPYAQQLLKYNKKINEHNEVLLKKKILEEAGLKQWRKAWNEEYDLVKKLNDRKTDCKKVLLSLTDAFPDITLENDCFEGWQKRSYDDYLSCVEKGKGILEAKTLKQWSNIIEDYIKYVQSLIECIKQWDKFGDINDPKLSTIFLYYGDMSNAEELRLHALYSKYNYAKLCCILMQKLGDKFKNVQYFRMQDDTLLLTGEDPKQQSKFENYGACFKDNNILIGVGYGYTNKTPLLEVKIVKKTDGEDDKLIYIVQVQGSHYEHGIIKKGSKRNVIDFVEDKEKNSRVNGWVSHIEDIDIFETKINDSYNGYNDTYSMVYKYRKIKDVATTGNVIDYVIKDVKGLVVDKLNKPE